MAAEGVGAIVEIKGMGGDAIDEGGIEHAGPTPEPEHQGRAVVTQRAPGGDGVRGDARAILGRTGQGDADGVQYPGLGPMECLVVDQSPMEVCYFFPQFTCYAHGQPP